MYRPLASSLVAAFVALALASPSVASVASEDVPVPGGTAAFAQAFGIDPAPDRSRFLYEMIRLLYNAPEGRRPAAEAYLQMLRQAASRGARFPDERASDRRGEAANELVPIPLSVDLWSTILRRRLAPREIVTMLIADRGAALICLGLSSLDDQTLQFFADHPSVLERIYDRSAAQFGAFGGGLQVQNNRVVPAGAPKAVAAGDRDDVTALWEAVVAEKTTRPERFIAQLMELNEGRVAYVYDVVARLDAPHRAFALGLRLPNVTTRVDRFKSLVGGVGAYREAHLKTLPFGRASYDLSMTLMRVQVDRDGVPAPPASRALWSRVFAGNDLPAATRSDVSADDDPIDAAWLSETIGSADVRLRGERLDQIAFAQRVFGEAPADQRSNVFIAIRALTHFRMLIWTLDRMGIRSPQVFAAAARRAARLSPLDGRRGFEAQAQFQGALAVLARMTTVKTITSQRAQALVEQLIALPATDDGRFAGAIARWMRDEIVGASNGASMEAAVLAAMSGAASSEGASRRLTWEGQPYRLDLGGAERKRLEHVRERQEGVPLDVPLQLAADARALAAEKITADEVRAIVERLNAAFENIPRRVGHEATTVNPAGVAAAPNVREALRKAIDEIARETRNRDARRVARAAEPIAEIVDTLMAQALLSIAYAADVGDPEGTVLLADDVSQRHDFGLGGKDTEGRLRVTWMVPRVDVSPGVPWHVTGSLLGLDVGLGTLALRRLNFERVLEAPKLTSNERDAFAISIALLNPFDLKDDDRDAIADAIARGRRRVGALTASDAAAFDQVVEVLGMEGARKRAVRWALAHERERVPSMFSATELLALGGGDLARLHHWGMSMVIAEGCLCSRLTPPGRWSTLLGRPPLGLTASAVADLNLHIATMLRELRLPAPIAKIVLSGAMQDFIDEVKPTDDSDWLTLARAARNVPRERIEDYVAAATAAGPLVPDTGTRDERR
ncbi:MAG TPA: hypothetical protein VKE51_19195 [Vicinamibacterales bacterium]|nr:hypothetical protein [Vicinamibacterales bacterium]